MYACTRMNESTSATMGVRMKSRQENEGDGGIED